jgi:hypothetical protein
MGAVGSPGVAFLGTGFLGTGFLGTGFLGTGFLGTGLTVSPVAACASMTPLFASGALNVMAAEAVGIAAFVAFTVNGAASVT